MTAKTTNQQPDTAIRPEGRRDKVRVTRPSDEARRVVSRVQARSIAEHRADAYERKVFETPGVLEAFDEALDEIERLKRSA